jgi:hypothetical protein
MQLNRSIRVSIKEHVKTAFELPISGGMNAFNVYGENNLPQNNPSFSPTRPYLYIVDSNIQPTLLDLPLIVLELTPFVKDVFELGRASRKAELNAHVYGRNRGERDDIASYLQDYLTTPGSGNIVIVKDYGTAGTPELDRGEVQLPVSAWCLTEVPEFRREEASTANVNIVNCVVTFKAK